MSISGRSVVSVESVEAGIVGRNQDGRRVAETPGGREATEVASMIVNQDVGEEDRVR
jgi:hypothetical protein